MADSLIGKTIGGYEIIRRIGQGGMATVYLARQNSMNRLVAIKVLPQQFLQDDTYLQRFEREVQIISKLEHRNIVPVYDYGEYEEQPYIVMRFLDAGSVADLIEQGRVDGEVALDILNQIAPALDYAYSKNILHRDLKPSNILLDDDGGAYLTDFGIARILSEKQSTITTQGVVGTPSYMSPEQAQGLPLDSRSDVYSFGVMLFEMLTGRRPFESDTPYSIAVKQVTEAPPEPRSLNPQISPAVEAVILRALRKKPEDRYRKVIELAEAYKSALESPPDQNNETAESQASTQPAPVSSEATVPQPRREQTPAPPVQTPVPRPISSQQVLASQIPSASQNAVPLVTPESDEGRSRMLGLVFGGLIGCGLLAGLVFAASLILNQVNTPEPTLEPTDETRITLPTKENTDVVPTPPLNATQDNARATLRSTFIATSTPVPNDQVGQQNVDLNNLDGRIVFHDRRGEGDSFEVIILDLDTNIETQITSDNSQNTYPVASPDGRWITFQSDRDGDFDIYVMNTVGGELRKVTDNEVWDRLPSWSPDGEWIIYSSDVEENQTLNLYRVRPDGSDQRLVFENSQRNSHARWSPDGRYLVFTAGADPRDMRTWEVVRLDLESDNNQPARLTSNGFRDASPTFRFDGNKILYVSSRQNGDAIVTMDINGNNKQILYDGPGNEWSANYNPDGSAIVFTSSQGGDDQIYVMTADGGQVRQITTTGGAYASWIPE